MDDLDPSNGLNMPEMADMTLAMDFLMRAKESVRNTAAALTETSSSDSRQLLRSLLHQSIALHQEISELMIRKKWFHPYELKEQFKLDQLAANRTVEIAKQRLFPPDTSRRGMLDRKPDKYMEGNKA